MHMKVPVPELTSERDSRCPFEAPAVLRDLANTAPITRVQIWDGTTPWFVTGYNEVRALLADPRASSDDFLPGYPALSEGSKQRKALARSIINLDNPEHARIRRMASSTFTVKNIEELRPVAQGHIDRLIDEMLAGGPPADLVRDFARPLPAFVNSHVLGLPYYDRAYIQSMGELQRNLLGSPEDQVAGQTAVYDYIDRFIQERMKNPADDFFSRMIVNHVVPGELTREQLAALGMVLIQGGNNTTAGVIVMSTLAMLENPELMATMTSSQDPAFIAAAVEEMLRYLGISQTSVRRVATEDIEIGGLTIRAGEGIVIAINLANRDSRAYDSPDSIDLARGNRHHMGFGFGAHQCIGAPLARMTLQQTFATLYRRIPTMRLAIDVESLQFKTAYPTAGLWSLPIAW
jgi:cytochrome P450